MDIIEVGATLPVGARFEVKFARSMHDKVDEAADGSIISVYQTDCMGRKLGDRFTVGEIAVIWPTQNRQPLPVGGAIVREIHRESKPLIWRVVFERR